MVGFPDLFGGSWKGEDSVCESWFGEGGDYAIGGFLMVARSWAAWAVSLSSSAPHEDWKAGMT